MGNLFRILLVIIVALVASFFVFKDTDTVKTACDFVSIKMGNRQSIEEVMTKYEPKVSKALEENYFFEEYGYPDQVFLFAAKTERILALYGKKGEGDYSLIKTYPFTAFSGNISPKLREGDLQIPEGIYQIENFNPNSLYHLSMKINYPNDFDKAKGAERGEKNLGGDIMIHGRSMSVGCIAIGDEAIEEVFVICQKASKKPIDLIISPNSRVLKGFGYSGDSFPDFYSELIAKIMTCMRKYEAQGVKFDNF